MTSLIIDIQSMPLWFSIPLGIVYLAALAYFIYTLWHYRRKNNIILLLFTIASLASGQKAWAESRTVTYTLSVNNSTIQFTKGGDTPINATLDPYGTNDILNATGFQVTLAENIYLQVRLTNAIDNRHMVGVTDGGVKFNGTATFTFRCPDKYIAHIAIKDQNGTAINGTVNYTATTFDLDVDLDKFGTDGATVTQWSGYSNSPQVKTISITYTNTPRNYIITYTDAVNGQNGVTNANPTNYNVTTPTFNITEPTRTGYTLNGVTYTDAQHTSATAVTLPQTINRGNAATCKNITYNFAWTAHHYTVHYDANGGSGSMANQDFTYDEGALNACAFTRTGYTFTGWSTTQNGSVEYTDQQATPNVTATDGATVTLYAQWTANTYTLRLNRNDGSGSYDDVPMTYDVAYTLPTLTRTDYVFEDWNTQADGNGNSYTDGQSVSNLTATQNGVFNLYAQWRQVAGSCGDNARWSYDDNGTLSITGTGGTDDYDWDDQDRPWEQYIGNITTVSIGSGITYIGEDAFAQCSNLATINGGNDLTDVDDCAFNNTLWLTEAEASTTVVYLGHVAYIGSGVSGDVTIADGIITIADGAFDFNSAITSVTIPATVTSIGVFAFRNCTTLTTVNVLGTTPPTLESFAFYLNSDYRSLARTFNVRSAAYKTTGRWADIYSKVGDYSSHNNFRLRVVSTLTLPDGVTASTAADGDRVTILGTDYYAEESEITLSTSGVIYSATYNDGSDHNVTDNGDGTWTFTMPAQDVTINAKLKVSYIDENGVEKYCTDYTFIASSNVYYGSTENEEAWYVVSGNVTIESELYIQDKSAHLILCDGATLTVSSPLYCIVCKGLTIYAQSGGTRTIIAESSTGHGIMTQDGDLTINGGNIRATSHNSDKKDGYGIFAINSNVTINGGNVSASADDAGIKLKDKENTITLGWTKATDRIYASRYVGKLVVKDGQVLYDGTTAYEGTLDADQLAAIAGKTLEPYNATPFFIDGTAILLDDDSAQPAGYKNADRIAALAANGQSHDIMLLGRTLYRDGDWNTLCLPFTVDGDNNSANKLFYNAVIMKFDYSYWYDTNGKIFDTNTDGSHRSGEVENGSLYLNFIFGKNNYIEAGCPYIVMWPDTELDNVEDPVFQGVTVTRTTPSYYTTEEGRDPQTGLGNVTFRGTYSPIDYTEDNHSILFLGTNNTLYYPKAGAHIGAFRCYFELGNGLTAGEPNSAVRGFNLNFDEQGTQTVIGHTDITDNTDKADAAWYTINGVKLDAKPNSKGGYIHGNKKVVIK